MIQKKINSVALLLSNNLKVRNYRSVGKTTNNRTVEVEKQLLTRKILRIISAFRSQGHFAASLDPLCQDHFVEKRGASFKPENVPSLVHFIKSGTKGHFDYNLLPDMGLKFDMGPYLDVETLNLDNDLYSTQKEKLWSVNELLRSLSGTYAGNVGVEISHLENDDDKRWLLSEIEKDMSPWSSTWTKSDPKQQRRTLQRLLRTDHACKFLTKKYPSSKVFGIEGCESLIPGLFSIMGRAAHKHGLEGIELGMTHRGRLSVLHDILGKPFKSICKDFNESEIRYGDVLWHLGTRATIEMDSLDGKQPNRSIHVSLAANPSHLEAVNPVVIGKCKAKQIFCNDHTRNRVMPLLLHGDAAFSGQGVVAETMELSNTKDYNVGGTLHVIINNQIGFTTDPRAGRSAYHCTHIAKSVGAPIFHVNADDVDAVVKVCKLATDWRMHTHKDCVVDLVSYRRHGHNEQDDPRITHPLMTNKIAAHPNVLEIYSIKLLKSGVIKAAELEEMSQAVMREYEEDYQQAKAYQPDPLEWLHSNWQGDAVGAFIAKRP